MKKSIISRMVLILSLLCVPALAETTGGTTIDLTQVVVAVIGVCSTLITAFLIPWLKEKLGLEHYARVVQITEMLVAAAEKLCETGVVTNKLQYVETELKKRGIHIDSAAIEAAVKKLDTGKSNANPVDPAA